MSNNYRWFLDRYHNDIKELHLDIEKHLRYLSELSSSENEMRDLLNELSMRTSQIIDKNHDWTTQEYRDFHKERVRIRELETLSDEMYELGLELGYINEDRKLKFESEMN